MRGNHFDYLLQDDAANFFQKVAIESAEIDATLPAATAVTMTKVAAAPKSAMEKVAARLDRDLGILKAAGPVGLNAGMTKRANAYIDVLMTQADLTPEQLGEVFDKVAAMAIRTDLEAAFHQLCDSLPDDHRELVDDTLIKIGAEMAKVALDEKAALIEKLAIGIGALNRLGHVAEETGALGKATKTLEGVGGVARSAEGAPSIATGIRAAGGAAKEVGGSAAKAVGSAGYRGLAAVGNAVVGKPLEAASKGIQKLRDFRTSRIMSAPERIEGALNKTKAEGAVGTGVKKSLEKQLGEADTKRTATLAKTNANPPKAQVPAAEAKAPKIESDRQQGQQAAAAAAKPPATPKGDSAPKEPKSDAAGEHAESATPPPPGGTEGKPAGFMDAWKKASTHGWKGLSDEEKGTLIRGGVTAALVYRAAAGKGAVTGGEGMI